jgi:hypothetical protein
MKISRWKDFAELVALIAVVGGLAAVVVELRQTQSALSAQAYQTRALDVINAMLELSANPERAILVSDYLDGRLTIDAASQEEVSQLRSHFYMRRTDLDNEHYQYQHGFLDPDSQLRSHFYMRRTDPDNEHYQYQHGFLDTDFYETTTKREIKAHAPHWRAFGIPEPRQQFSEEVDRILADPDVKSALE